MNTRIQYLILFLLLCTLSANAKIELPAIMSDNMVLQQKSSVNLWGKADKNKKITIHTSWDNKIYTSTSSTSGEWLIKVNTPSAGGPYEITISDGEEVKLKNILIGEVWLCSGQSNMFMPLRGYSGQPIEGALDQIMEAKPNNNIRMFTIDKASSTKPEYDCKGAWLESTPQSAIRFSAAAYYFAQHLQKMLNVPIGLICSSFGGSKIQSWINKETYEQQFPEISLDVLNQNIEEIESPRSKPTLLYNAMIVPIKNYTIKGALWYQGESNRKEPELHSKLFPAMVQSWRDEWAQGTFPFYYVQIAPHNYENADGLDAAHMRQSQLDCMNIIPESGMVVTADIGDGVSIHPPKKKEVGQRLALWALAKTYKQKDIPYSGPLYKSAKTEANKMIVEFEHAELGLHSTQEKIEGFELAGKDKIFYPAEAELIEKAIKVSLTSKDVPNPVYLRYAYRNYQLVTLFNNYGLPISPFTTDK